MLLIWFLDSFFKILPTYVSATRGKPVEFKVETYVSVLIILWSLLTPIAIQCLEDGTAVYNNRINKKYLKANLSKILRLAQNYSFEKSLAFITRISKYRKIEFMSKFHIKLFNLQRQIKTKWGPGAGLKMLYGLFFSKTVKICWNSAVSEDWRKGLGFKRGAPKLGFPYARLWASTPSLSTSLIHIF